jgi:hypothetical protein
MKTLSKSFFILLLLCSELIAFADEGMWLPLLLKQLNEKDMKSMGMKLSAEDIYAVNKSSLKDAIVLFGRGCTGEVISSEGLLLTNHHCGFGQIQEHSSLEHDYLMNGFWAMNRSEELPNKGLTVTFIIRMEDVTDRVTQGLNAIKDEAERESIVTARSAGLVKEAVGTTHYEAFVKPMYNGNEYYLFVSETFRDVRLVGAPPQSMGNFGKDTDNWVWPRHTADFSLFRIYAGKDNKPADYSPDNVPFKPRKHLEISTSGVKENDFTMVYGFPGRTNEYLSSNAVDQLVNKSNPLKVDLRKQRLDIMDKYMKADRKVFIQYADKYSGVSNYHKKWAGEARGLEKANAVERKKILEQEFAKRIKDNAQFKAYQGILDGFNENYSKLERLQPELDLFTEGILSIELLRFAIGFKDLIQASSEPGSDKWKKQLQAQNERVAEFFKDYSEPIDRETMQAMLKAYYSYGIASAFIPADITTDTPVSMSLSMLENYTSNFFTKSKLKDESFVRGLLEKGDTSIVSSIKSDPAWRLADAYFSYYRNVLQKQQSEIMSKLIPLNRLYVEALRTVMPEKKYYPDANSTLRVAFGKVEGYSPADATHYTWFTTADGILQKNRAGAADHEINERLKQLLETRNYGAYADKDGTLHTCFAASNHTTGGNSGSPVLNAKGQLIGTNFDRNWEGTMSDVYYDINQVRNIVLDVRYTLWVIDVYAGAKHLIQEMSLSK